MIRERSEKAIGEFEKGNLDWVYIDTTHTYKQTMKELKVCARKVKDGGIIAGHDYSKGYVPRRSLFGVIAAVHKFCSEKGWKIEYLTLETDGNRSFALKEM